MAAALPLLRRHRRCSRTPPCWPSRSATGGTEVASGSSGARAIYGERARPDRPARDRLRRRPPPGRRDRRLLARGRSGRPRRRPLRRPDHRRRTTIRRLAPAGRQAADRPGGPWHPSRRSRPWTSTSATLQPYVGPPISRQDVAQPDPDLDLAVGTHAGRLRAEPRRLAPVHGARPARQRDPDPARGGARGRRARHPPAARRPGHRPVHPQRRARTSSSPPRPSTAFAMRRSPGGQESSTARPTSRPSSSTQTCARTGFFECSEPDCSTSCTAMSCGAPRATSSTCPPTARSATNGSAGPVTSRRSRLPRRTCSTSRTFLADWLRRPRRGAASRTTASCRSSSPTSSSTCPRPGRSPTRTAPRSGATRPSGCRGRSTQAYGDPAVLERQYPSMADHVRRVETLAVPGRACGTRRSSSATGSTRTRSPHEPWNAKADTRRRRHRLPATGPPSIVAETAALLGHTDDAAAFRRARRPDPRGVQRALRLRRRHHPVRLHHRLHPRHRLRPPRRGDTRPRRATGSPSWSPRAATTSPPASPAPRSSPTRSPRPVTSTTPTSSSSSVSARPGSTP